MVMHLSNVGIFPVDLIKTIFDQAFLDRAYKNNVFKIGWDHLALESNIRTELPDYEGPFLSDNVRRFLAKALNNFFIIIHYQYYYLLFLYSKISRRLVLKILPCHRISSLAGLCRSAIL